MNGSIVAVGLTFLLAPVVVGGMPKFVDSLQFSLRGMRIVERWMPFMYGGFVGGVFGVSQPTLSIETLEIWWPAAVSIPAFVLAQRAVRRAVEMAIATSDGKPGALKAFSEWFKGDDIPDEETLRLRASVPSAKEQLEASDAALLAAQGLSEPSNSGEGDLALVEGDGS